MTKQKNKFQLEITVKHSLLYMLGSVRRCAGLIDLGVEEVVHKVEIRGE